MTLRQALDKGYTMGDTAYFRGYVSRKINPDCQPVKTAGGRRAGELYVELPCWQSSQYAIRQYLRKPTK